MPFSSFCAHLDPPVPRPRPYPLGALCLSLFLTRSCGHVTLILGTAVPTPCPHALRGDLTPACMAMPASRVTLHGALPSCDIPSYIPLRLEHPGKGRVPAASHTTLWTPLRSWGPLERPKFSRVLGPPCPVPTKLQLQAPATVKPHGTGCNRGTPHSCEWLSWSGSVGTHQVSSPPPGGG